jgi:hypothetical protein
VAHVRKELGLHVVRAPQVIRFLVELGVERDDAAIRVLELTVQLHQLVLPLAQLGERAQELLILLLQFLVGADGRLRRQVLHELGHARRRDERRAWRQHLAQGDVGACAARRADLDAIHQAMRADETDAHAGAGAIASAQDVRDILDAGALVRHFHE